MAEFRPSLNLKKGFTGIGQSIESVLGPCDSSIFSNIGSISDTGIRI